MIEDKVYHYQLTSLNLLESLDCSPNKLGILAVSPSIEHCLIAFPDKLQGSVRIVNYGENQDEGKQSAIKAHDGTIQHLSLNHDGTVLATASEKGTLVRLFSTSTGEKLQEVRRGADTAIISHIAFDSQSQIISVCSEKGTVHLFLLSNATKAHVKDKPIDGEVVEFQQSTGDSGNTKSMFSSIGGVLPSYFSSEWSFASFKIVDSDNVKSAIIAGNHAIVAS